jgi:hypothetical protein
MSGVNEDARDKFDHSDHPTDRKLPDDLHAPNGGTTGRPESPKEHEARPDPVERRT